jgi:hypothetical protein
VTIAPCQVGRSGKPQYPFDRRPSSDCNVHRALAAGERTAVGAVAQGQQHHAVSRSRRAEAAVTAFVLL